jgi:hypothetical protein
MRTTFAAAALVAGLALAPGATSAPGANPSVRFFNLIPVKVRGAHFVPGERVRLTLRAGAATRVRTAVASTRGSFAVSFGRLAEKDRCSGSVAVTAVGARGDRVSYRLPQMACPAMATDANS